MLMRPAVTFRPTMPHHAAGSRTEPPVSVPIAAGARPAATATAEPLDEPPGVRCTARSQGFHGVPRWVLVPNEPIANSTVCVLPSTIMPAPISRSASVAVTGETRSIQTFEPPVVTRPWRSTRSFSAIGMPCSGPIRWPLVIARSAASAASRASYSYRAIYACNASRALMRASSAPTTSTGDSARLSNAADSSARPAQTGSTTLMTSVLLPGLLRPGPARAPTRGTTPDAGACGRR